MYAKEAESFRKTRLFNSIFSIFINASVVILIMTKTPTPMKTYRWYLLNIVFWSGVFDIYMGCIFAPQLMFPATALCVNGVSNSPNSPFMTTFLFILFVILLGGTGISVFCAYLYRLSTVANETHWIHRPGVIPLLIGIHVVYTLPTCILLVLIGHWDSEALRQDMIQTYPSLFNFSATHSCFYFSWTERPILSGLFFAFAIIEIVLCVLVVLGLRVLVTKKVNALKGIILKKTFDLHHQLNNSLSVQFLLPEFFLVVPFLFIIALILTGNNESKLAMNAGHILMIFSSMHSLFNAASMIGFTGPYRRACLALFKSVRPRRGTVSAVDGPMLKTPELRKYS